MANTMYNGAPSDVCSQDASNLLEEARYLEVDVRMKARIDWFKWCWPRMSQGLKKFTARVLNIAEWIKNQAG